jgi:hypothetical protein
VPDTYAQQGVNWQIESGNGTGVGPGGVHPLAFTTSNGTTDIAQDVFYANPLTPTTFAFSASLASRGIALDNATPTSVVNESQWWVPVKDMTTCQAVDATPIGAIASYPTLEGDTLDHDVTMSIDPTIRPTLSWSVDAAADAFNVAVDEVEVDAGMTTLVRTATVFTNTPQLRFEPGTFVSGHHYVIVINAQVGSPGAAMGDFTAFAYPFGISTTFSHLVSIE